MGALDIYEALINDQRRSHTFGLPMNLDMALATPTGRDYMGAGVLLLVAWRGFHESRRASGRLGLDGCWAE
jgi:hypothetical protein